MTISSHPLVAVVIVGFNGKDLVADCVRSLRTLDHAPLLVIYVDNGSSDGTLDHVRTEFPEVVALPSGGNLGYCGGNNLGLTHALQAGADFVLILNPDTVVCNPRFITELVDYLAAHPDVGKVGPKVYLREHGVVQDTILTWPSISESFFSTLAKLLPGERAPVSASLTKPTAVPAIVGCCVLVRAEALRDVGLFDAGFWSYVDEVDWDWRALQAGWQRHYVPVESIVHLQKKNGYDFVSLANYYIKRNTALWYAKNGKWFSMGIWMTITLAIAIMRAILAPLSGRSCSEYFTFVGKIARAYREVLSDAVRGKIRRPPNPPDKVAGRTMAQA